MKKAIVLMMTLGFIAIITALVLYTLSISQRSFKQVAMVDGENQFSLIFRDFTHILQQNSKEVNSSQMLEMLLSFALPPIKEAKTGVEVGFMLESRMSKLNLNAILEGLQASEGNCDLNLTTELLCRPLDRFFDLFEIRDKILLKELLLDTIDKDDIELGSETEIALEDIDFMQGRVYSFNHLKKIFERYYQLSSDKNIYRIKEESFSNYFYFGETNQSKQWLDCSAFLFPAKSMQLILDESWLVGGESQDFCALFQNEDPELQKIKRLYHIKPFDSNETTRNYLIKCDLSVNTDISKKRLVFDYDLIHKRIESIENTIQE